MKQFLLNFTLAVGLFGATAGLAQQKENHTLLWRISGNGLSEDSYLYGTMHLQDERVYDFSDSVLLKLDHCKAFAMEVNPDSIIYYLFKDMVRPGQIKKKMVKETLSPEDYRALADKFKEKTGFELDQINQSDPAYIIQLMEREEMGNADNATFLDAYLYDVALRRGKTIVSLEDVQDQLEAFQYRSPLQVKQKLEALAHTDREEEPRVETDDENYFIKIYQEGDLNTLWQYFLNISQQDSLGKAFVDKMLIARNYGMHHRLVAQIKASSTFAAVGAGHLPGEEGLLALLRKSGYSVTPVPAIFTGLAQKQRLEFQKPALSWQVFSQEAYGYSVELPRQPFPLHTAEVPFPIYFYPELGTGLYYMTLAINSGSKAQDDAQVLKQIVESMGANMGSLVSKKNISTKQMAGTEAYYRANDAYVRSQIYVQEGMIYMLATIANRPETLESENATRFFKSFKKQELKSLVWQTFVDEKGAFSVNMCGEPFYSNQEINDPDNPSHVYNLHLFSTQNTHTGTFYLFRYNNMPQGMIMQYANEDAFAGIANGIAASSGGTLTKSQLMKVDQYNAYYFEFAKDEFLGYGKIVIRGNRLYLMLAAASEQGADRQEISDYLNSLKFLPYQQEQMTPYVHEDFSVLFPNEAVHLEEHQVNEYYYLPSVQESTSYLSTSEVSGHVFSVNQEKIFKYYTLGSDSAFYSQIKTLVLDYGDSVLWERDFSLNGLPAKEFLVKDTNGSNYQRGMVLPIGEKLYAAWATVSYGEERSQAVESFLQSFQVKEKATSSMLLRSKASVSKTLLQDLMSQDTLINIPAQNALPYYVFDSSSIADLYAVYQQLTLNDAAKESEIREELILKMVRIPNEKTISFLEEQYNLLPDTASLKIAIIRGLMELDTEPSFLKAKELLLKTPPTRASDSRVSLFGAVGYMGSPHVSVLYPDVLELLQHERLAADVLGLTRLALDSSMVDKAVVETYSAVLDNLGATYMNNFLAGTGEEEGYYRSIYNPLNNYVRLIKSLTLTSKREELLRKLIAVDTGYLGLQAIEVLLANGRKVDKAAVGRYAAKTDFRLQIYEMLKESNRLDLFPKKYLNQKSLAESVFSNMLEYHDEYPDKFDFVKKLKVIHEGAEAYVYVFKFSYTYEEETEEYVGYAGVYASNKKEVEIKEDISSYLYTPIADKKEIDSAIQDLVAKQANPVQQE